MDIRSLAGKAQSLIGKYKYAFIVLIIGLVLLLLPNNTKKTEQADCDREQN